MIKGINHITFAVKELKTSFEFYKNIIGLKPVFRSSDNAYFLAGEQWIALIEDEKTRGKQLDEYTHISFTVDKEEFEAFKLSLAKNNVRLWKDNTSEGESLYFLDPDGHKFEFHVNGLEERLIFYKENMKADYIFY